MTSHDLLLYHFQACPYCDKVRRFLASVSLDVPMKDILLDPQAKWELMDVGGKAQVPCLVIDGVALYESDDIILWIKENLLA